jgi:hypothetical protein
VNHERRCLWDSRAGAAGHGAYSELYLPSSMATGRRLKAFRDSDYQAICPIQITRAPRTTEELAEDEDASTLVMALGYGGKRRYDKVVILREDASFDISAIVETIGTFCPEFLEQRRVFVADLSSPFEMDDFHRTIGTPRLVNR